MNDGWSERWWEWYEDRTRRRSEEAERLLRIREVVRRAVTSLPRGQRDVIEGHYYDGLSLGQIAAQMGVSKNRVLFLYRQAHAELRLKLAGFVAETFGISCTQASGCPICIAPWRAEAEAILDTRTPETTWGDLMARLERAFGFRVANPQVLIIHDRKHRSFAAAKPIPKGEEADD